LFTAEIAEHAEKPAEGTSYNKTMDFKKMDSTKT